MRLRLTLALAVAGAATVVAGVPIHAQAGPAGMPDPRQMSGMPRPDPQVAPGTVTVRCLLGSFAEPAVGATVSLVVTGPDGSSETRQETTQAQGRATFSGLEPFTGGHAVATVSFDGQEVGSQRIALGAEMGSRVLLVKGASAGGPSTAPAAPQAGSAGSAHGGAGDVPPPGQPFPIEGHPAGTLVVGTLDMEDRGRAAGIEVTLTIEPPGGDPVERTGVSDASARVVFPGLVPPDVPAGSKLSVQAQIRPGGAIQKSSKFEMGESAVAVYLAEGFEGIAARQPQQPQQRPRLPGPRAAPDLDPGVVRVRIVDGKGAPVAGQPLQVWKKDVTGNDVAYDGVTGDDGVAVVKDVKVQGDAFYFVGVAYDGAPFQSTFFEIHDREGTAIDMRVFPVTSDVGVVRSAVRYEIRPRENDLAEVVQSYQVFVEGDAAWWPRDGKFRLEGPDGTRGMVVLRNAKRWLEEKKKSPFAVLANPIAPGELADLSVAYLLPHDGELELTWQAPFPVMDSSVILPIELDLLSPGVEPSEPGPNAPDDLQFYAFGSPTAGAPVKFTVGRLPTRPNIFKWFAFGLGGLVVLGAGAAIYFRPRRTMKQRLEERRQQLMEELRTSSEAADRARIVSALDDLYGQIDALADAAEAAPDSAG